MSSRTWRRDLTALAERYGCTVDDTGPHLRIVHPSGWTLSCSRSPSDHRALRNVESDIRKKRTGIWR